MSKMLKLIGIIAFIGALGYVFFLFFVSPGVENDKVTLTKDFMDNISDTTICDTHFNPETKSICTTFRDTFKDETDLEYSLVTVGDVVRITFTDAVTENEIDFEFTFLEETNTGISGFFHSTNYKIDLIE